jgi:hyaluronan synthase
MSLLTFFIPLGLLGLIRWSCWLVHRIPASFYQPVVTGHREPMTLVVPVYQEDPVVFRQALESWLWNEVDEIICVIDVTDETCAAIAREYGERVRVIITEVPGKRPALRDGWEAARTPLVALVDSDVIWAGDTYARLCEPFDDPKVGGVGSRQNALNPIGLWQNAADMYLDYRYFDEIAAQTVVGQAVSCLSGRTAVYRREFLCSVSDEFINETFLGVQCISGDDKRLTCLALIQGYRTVLQRNARVWSTFPATFRGFRKQRTRWARNTWRSDLRSMRQGWVFRHRMLAFMELDKMVSGFTLLFSVTFFIVTLVYGFWLTALTLVSWWLVSRAAKMMPHLRRRPENLRLLPAFIMVSLTMACIKIWALLTVRKQQWLTRDVAVVGGSVQRTGDEP